MSRVPPSRAEAITFSLRASVRASSPSCRSLPALPCCTRGPLSASSHRMSSRATKCQVGRSTWVRTIVPSVSAPIDVGFAQALRPLPDRPHRRAVLLGLHREVPSDGLVRGGEALTRETGVADPPPRDPQVGHGPAAYGRGTLSEVTDAGAAAEDEGRPGPSARCTPRPRRRTDAVDPRPLPSSTT